MSFDDRLYAAARQLADAPDVHTNYQRYRDVEHAYRLRTENRDGVASIESRASALDAHFRGEDAARAGDTALAAACFAESQAHGGLDGEPIASGTTAGTTVEPDWRQADLEIVAAAARSGDAGATGELLRRLRPLAQRYCRARLGWAASLEYVDDLVTEVCMAALIQPLGKQPFLASTYGIASRVVTDRLRARAVADTAGWTVDAIVDALHVLPSAQRDVVVLRVVLGLSADQVAQELRTTPGAVRVAQHRAMTRLRSILRQAPPRYSSGPPVLGKRSS